MTTNEPQGCLFAIFKLLGIAGEEQSIEAVEDRLPYRRMKYLFSKAERSFFDVLEQIVEDRYVVFAKVRMADLLYIAKGTPKRQSFQNRINCKHIDFVLCDPKFISPILAIELDDSSHDTPSRQNRDLFVDDALAAANLPLLRVRVRRSYDNDNLRAAIEEHIAAGS